MTTVFGGGAPFIQADMSRNPGLPRILAAFLTRRAEKRSRREIAALLQYEDFRLRDMGLTRDQVRAALRQPPEVDAGELLNRSTGRAPAAHQFPKASETGDLK